VGGRKTREGEKLEIHARREEEKNPRGHCRRKKKLNLVGGGPVGKKEKTVAPKKGNLKNGNRTGVVVGKAFEFGLSCPGGKTKQTPELTPTQNNHNQHVRGFHRGCDSGELQNARCDPKQAKKKKKKKGGGWDNTQNENVKLLSKLFQPAIKTHVSPIWEIRRGGRKKGDTDLGGMNDNSCCV